MRKVIDCNYNMPDEITDALYKAVEDEGYSNNTYFTWRVGEHQSVEGSSNLEKAKFMKQVDDWLLLNFENGEDVLILFWW
jgi:hypothetical protein